MKKIWAFITGKDNQRTVLLIVLVIFALFYLKQCDRISTLDTNNSVLAHNQEYYKDTIYNIKNKVDELQFERTVLLTTNSMLKKDTTELGKELKKQNGTIISLTNTVIKLRKKKPETITNIITKYPDGTIGLKWGFNNQYKDSFNYRILKGETKFYIIDSSNVFPGSTTLFEDEIGLKLTTGIKEVDGQLKIFIKSKYPGFKVTRLNGALIDPKKSKIIQSLMPQHKWAFGPTFSTGLMYNPANSTVGPYIGIGIGLTRRITKQDIKNFFKK